MYKAKIAVCSDIRTKHSTQREHHVEFLNFKTWWYVKKPLGSKRLIEHLIRNEIVNSEVTMCLNLKLTCQQCGVEF